MITNRYNLNVLFPIPIITNRKWWDEHSIKDVFKKDNNFKINAGASCSSVKISDDKKPNDNKTSPKLVKKNTSKKPISKTSKKSQKN